jgi:hypothetical protein
VNDFDSSWTQFGHKYLALFPKIKSQQGPYPVEVPLSSNRPEKHYNILDRFGGGGSGRRVYWVEWPVPEVKKPISQEPEKSERPGEEKEHIRKAA